MAFNYRLIVNYTDGTREKFGGKKCHSTKSLAGTLFQSKRVARITVVDKNGDVWLYLVKGDPDKTENVPSTLATLG